MKQIKAIIFLIFIGNSSYAQFTPPAYLGILSQKFEQYFVDQINSEWCWAASLQMVFNYNTISIRQDQIVQRTFGNLGNNPANDQIITGNLNNTNVDNNGKKYVVSASFNPGFPPANVLISELNLQHPILIGYQSSFNSRHVVVITACSFSQNPNPYLPPIIKTIIVRDPFPYPQPNPQNFPPDGKIEYNANYLGNLITAYWIPQISIIP